MDSQTGHNIRERTRLAELMDRRRLQLRLRWSDVADTAQVHRETLRIIRQGEGEIRPLTKRGIEDALQWAPGSIDNVLDNGDPIEIARVTATAGAPSTVHGLAVALQPAIETPSSREITPRAIPKWLTAELDRRGLQADAVASWVETLRDLAEHHDYTLAELLLNAGLVEEGDLAINERPARGSEALAEFDANMSRVLASPFLTPRERKSVETRAAQARQAAIDKHLGGSDAV